MLDDEMRENMKWVVYRGSIYSNREPIPHEFWLMTEDEWEERQRGDDTGSAVLLARGLTHSVANKMIALAKEQ